MTRPSSPGSRCGHRRSRRRNALAPSRFRRPGQARPSPSQPPACTSSSGSPSAPRRIRICPNRVAVRRPPTAGRSRCAWASRNARQVVPFRRESGVGRRRTAESDWAQCAAGRGRPDRSTGKCATTRRPVPPRAGSRSAMRAPRPPACGSPVGQGYSPKSTRPVPRRRLAHQRLRSRRRHPSCAPLHPSAAQQEIEMQAVKCLGVLVLRPVTTTRHHFESCTRDHRRHPPALGHIGSRVVTGPEHQRGRSDRTVFGWAKDVACPDLGTKSS